MFDAGAVYNLFFEMKKKLKRRYKRGESGSERTERPAGFS